MVKPKAITPAPAQAVSPEGMIGQILELERLAKVKVNEGKKLQTLADALREQAEIRLKEMGIKSVRHESGYTATLTKGQTKFAFADKQKLLEKLKEHKLVIYIDQVPEQIIPPHEAIREDLLAEWCKTAGAKNITEMFGDAVQVKQAPDHLTINKPKD